MQEIKVSRLSAGSVFKFGYVAYAMLFLPIMVLLGLYGMSGGTAVYQNGQPVYGIAALITAIFIGLIIPAILAVWLLLGTLILRLAKDRAPSLRTGD
ncbi:hypothetical protein [Sphingosinicella soli]|uniref:Uncharacterized protein n=1 Tax=Sphingosinicella soli TaxID=333708 RepID=A0A7W7AZJ9_9SPHN|nr:hypothetical protein [Sphingosinicella soli]MBB4631227.1 hypothetical protein [Sphingosinicella soli]